MPTRTYTDLDLNFISNPVTGDISKNIGNSAVINSVMNLLRTNHFEKKFHPQIGSNITSLLFEPLTTLTANALQKEITNTLKNFEPRVTIRYLSVTPNDNRDGFDIRLEFYIDNQVAPVAISTFLERIN